MRREMQVSRAVNRTGAVIVGGFELSKIRLFGHMCGSSKQDGSMTHNGPSSMCGRHWHSTIANRYTITIARHHLRRQPCDAAWHVRGYEWQCIHKPSFIFMGIHFHEQCSFLQATHTLKPRPHHEFGM